MRVFQTPSPNNDNHTQYLKLTIQQEPHIEPCCRMMYCRFILGSSRAAYLGCKTTARRIYKALARRLGLDVESTILLRAEA